MAFFPQPLTARPNISAGTFANLRPPHRNSERDFKRDLIGLLKQQGVPGNQLKEIFDYLQRGSDRQIGNKLRAMMSTQPPLIRPGLATDIAQLAARNGVTSTSIDRQDLYRPISPEEAQSTLGRDVDVFTNRLGLSLITGQSMSQIAAPMFSMNPPWMAA